MTFILTMHLTLYVTFYLTHSAILNVAFYHILSGIALGILSCIAFGSIEPRRTGEFAIALGSGEA